MVQCYGVYGAVLRETVPADGFLVEEFIHSRRAHRDPGERVGVGFKQSGSVLLLPTFHPVAVHAEGTRVNQLPHIAVLVRTWAECLHAHKC